MWVRCQFKSGFEKKSKACKDLQAPVLLAPAFAPRSSPASHVWLVFRPCHHPKKQPCLTRVVGVSPLPSPCPPAPLPLPCLFTLFPLRYGVIGVLTGTSRPRNWSVDEEDSSWLDTGGNDSLDTADGGQVSVVWAGLHGKLPQFLYEMPNKLIVFSGHWFNTWCNKPDHQSVVFEW